MFNFCDFLNLFNYYENIVNFYKVNNIDMEELELRKILILYSNLK